MVVLALLLIAIAAAIDIAWMAPGQATPRARAEQVVTPEQAAAAADAMAAAHHTEKVSSSAVGTQSGTN